MFRRASRAFRIGNDNSFRRRQSPILERQLSRALGCARYGFVPRITALDSLSCHGTLLV
jgi:hypothetical protein